MAIFKRVLQAGAKGFYRNRTVSLSSIFILTITLTLIAALFLFKAVFNYTVSEIQSKVDISIYFKSDAPDESILRIKNIIEAFPETKKIEVISKDDTLTIFKQKHAADEATMQALAEVGSNPFGASMSVQATDTDGYATIMNKINENKILGDDYNSVDKINYVDVKDSIDKLGKVVAWFSNIGYILTLVFIGMSLMIIYNTTRLAIFVFKDEISVMKLVGASNMYIRGPFIIESIIYGLIAAILAIAICYPATSWLGSHTVSFFEGLNIFDYFKAHILELFIILAISGVLVSAISSILAVRKYLRV